MITIIDYGMGNLRSVQKALEKVGAQAVISSDADRIGHAEKLILPGVGAFRDAAAALRDRQMIEPIRAHVAADRPLLGICLGLQLLFEVSYEDGEYAGLEITPGKVVRFEDRPGLKVPHMGWNQLVRTGDVPLLAGIPPEAWFYFVHSYYVVPADKSVIATHTRHGEQFVSMIQRGRLSATQFHPEKSQAAGLQLLKNFADLK